MEPEIHYSEDSGNTEEPRRTGDISSEKRNRSTRRRKRNKKTKANLPEDLAKSVVKLTCESKARGGSCFVYLIGTTHVSRKSCREVEELVRFLKPEIVFLELCASRKYLLKPETNVQYTLFIRHVLLMMIPHRSEMIASQLDVTPGAEFRVAYQEALKYGGKIVLGDRPIQITLARTWGKMPLWHKVKFILKMGQDVFSLEWPIGRFLSNPEEVKENLEDVIENMDIMTSIEDMCKHFPSFMDTLVNERDQYMASSLLRTASKHSSVVAVVGKGHINGIKKNWKQPITMLDLMEIPSNEPVFTVKRILSALAFAFLGIVLSIVLARRW